MKDSANQWSLMCHLWLALSVQHCREMSSNLLNLMLSVADVELVHPRPLHVLSWSLLLALSTSNRYEQGVDKEVHVALSWASFVVSPIIWCGWLFCHYFFMVSWQLCWWYPLSLQDVFHFWTRLCCLCPMSQRDICHPFPWLCVVVFNVSVCVVWPKETIYCIRKLLSCLSSGACPRLFVVGRKLPYGIDISSMI